MLAVEAIGVPRRDPSPKQDEKFTVLALQRMKDVPSSTWSVLVGQPIEAACSDKSEQCCQSDYSVFC